MDGKERFFHPPHSITTLTFALLRPFGYSIFSRHKVFPLKLGIAFYCSSSCFIFLIVSSVHSHFFWEVCYEQFSLVFLAISIILLREIKLETNPILLIIILIKNNEPFYDKYYFYVSSKVN
jgi:hypothetical protein